MFVRDQGPGLRRHQAQLLHQFRLPASRHEATAHAGHDQHLGGESDENARGDGKPGKNGGKSVRHSRRRITTSVRRLDIVRRLVRHNEGDISVESRPGRTEFRVALPVAE